MIETEQPDCCKPWPDYRAVWRWHFYAGLFCIPFIIVLASSGSIYLFKPQIESWIDRHYDNLAIKDRPASAADQIRAALAAIPGSTLNAYEVPEARWQRRPGDRESRGKGDPCVCASGNACKFSRRSMRTLDS